MSLHTDPKNNFGTFSLSETKDWTEAAKKELNGEDPFVKLSFVSEGIKIKPYYDRTDTPPDFSFSLPHSSDIYLGPRAWYNMPRINGDDPSANEKALHALNNGADGILFELTSALTDVEKLLDKIDLNYCNVSFLTEDVSFPERLKESLRKRNSEQKISGCLFFKNEIKADFEPLKTGSSFRQIGVVVSEKEAVEEIADAINQILNYTDQLTDAGWKVEEVFGQVAVLIGMSTDFFLSIAKLKSLQIIWKQVVKTYGVDTLIDLPIHVWCKPWVNKYHPNGNMLKSTTVGIAAVVGGCHALTLDGEEENNTMNERIARNISSILREESHLSKVADPTAGSYYIDRLTYELALAAWEKIKSKS